MRNGSVLLVNSDASVGDPYRRRIVDDELDALMTDLAAISIDGAKGVGKTATALQRAATVFSLDNPATLEIVRAGPDRLVSGTAPTLVDEWHRFPASWDVVRRAVDAHPAPGRFLLTGSASPQSPATHSGAGRIVGTRMRPLTLPERGRTTPTVALTDLLTGSRPAIEGASTMSLGDYVEEIVRGGFPGINATSDRAQRAALGGYTERIVDRDFPEAGLAVRNPALLRRWLAAYAAATATNASYEAIRDASTSGSGDKPAKTTTIPYRDTLTRIWISDPVPAWTPGRNHPRRLTQGPKHHLADPALAVVLTGLTVDDLIEGRAPDRAVPRDGTFLGALFESLMALELRVFAQAAEAAVAHLRTERGEREIDFIVTGRNRRVVAIEVKLSETVDDRDVRHLRWLAEQVGDELADAVVITTGPQAYRRADGIAVVPAALLGP